ncbi:MAG: hypothetical protein QXU69_03385 [Thermofilaceae archaeon]
MSLEYVSSIEAYKWRVIDAIMAIRAVVNTDPAAAVEELETLMDVLPPEIRDDVEERIADAREEVERTLAKMPSYLSREEEAEVRAAYRSLARRWLRAIIDTLTDRGFILWRREVLTGYEEGLEEYLRGREGGAGEVEVEVGEADEV